MRDTRISAIRSAALAGAMLLLCVGCGKAPFAEGAQTVEGKGRLGVIRIAGPQAVGGKLDVDRPVRFPVELAIAGPPNGGAQIVAQITGGAGCGFDREFPFTVALDPQGKAVERRTLEFGAPLGCAVEFHVEVGTGRKSQPTGIYGVVAENYPADDTETLIAVLKFELRR